MSAPPPNRPLVVRAINTAGALAGRFASAIPSLEENRLLAAAEKATGLSDYGGDGFREGMRRLIHSLEHEARLNTLGRISAREQILGHLRNRLDLQAYRCDNAEVAAQEIRRPLFILGLPRTGTTVLFNLMAQDPANRVPLGWEVQTPHPPPEADSYYSDPRIARAQKQFDNLYKLEPALAPIHVMGASLPQECVALLAHEFMSVQFHIIFNVPGYQAWLDTQSYLPAYETHRRFLQHLQCRHRRERWVLKSPGHLAVIDDLLAVYPDACIVHTHRDPMKVMPSLASLSYTLRGLSTEAGDARFTGRQQAELWAEHLHRAVRAREKAAAKKDQFFDAQFSEVLADPIAMVERIYEYFGFELGSQARRRMEVFLAANPRGKHGSHKYTLEEFGLDRRKDGPRFDEYCERFSVPREG